MKQVKRIYIVGHPGAGKAVCGKYLAEKLHWDFIDADLGIELKTGALVNDVLGQEGNEYFRQYENKILTQFADQENVIVNTDAGVVLSEKNREFLKNEFVVFVTCPLDVQLERFSKHSPSLLESSDLKTLLSSLHERDAIFESIANHVGDTSVGSIDEHLNGILTTAGLESSVVTDKAVKLDESDYKHLHRETHKPVELTEQQATVLKLLAHGKSAKEIARDLDISYRTVEGHLATIKDILGCSSSKDLIALYLGKI